MSAYLKSAVASAIVFLGLDFVWLSWISIDFYRDAIGAHLADTPNLGAAALFYLLYLSGLTYFVTIPAIRSGRMSRAVLSGAVFGLVTYGTYDLTNMATMANWPLSVTVVDMVWGGCLTAIASGAGFLLKGSRQESGNKS